MALPQSPPEPREPAPGAKPKGGAIGKRIGPFPAWVWLVGVGGVAIVFYRRRSASAAAAAAGVGTNGDTLSAGAPIDASGAPVGSTGTGASGLSIDDWRTAAFKALVHAGVSPALAEQALSNFLNQNALGPQQSAAIDKALGLVGAPPVNLPFYGTIPTTGPTKPPPRVPTGATHDPGFRVAPIASFPHVQLGPGEHIVDVIRTNTTGAGYYLSNLGGVFAVGGAPFLGSAFTHPHAAGTQFQKIELNSNGGYTLLATNGHAMTFAPKTKAA